MENTDDQVVKEELFELMIQAISSDFFHDAISILEPMMLIIDKQLVEPDHKTTPHQHQSAQFLRA